jgi:hypothetical protein
MFRKSKSALCSIVIAMSLGFASSVTLADDFSYDKNALPNGKPWTSETFTAGPDNFQFVIIGDRTGGANQEGTFDIAINQLKLLQPEFVINVGDMIEGYSDQKTELIAEWDEIDEKLKTLQIPFFRTPGNHDIANKTAQEVWRERYGATYYHFLYKNTLFLVLDSEDPPREAPPGMKEKLDLYNRLQTEDPAKAQEMLAEFMSDESVVAGLAQPAFNNANQANLYTGQGMASAARNSGFANAAGTMGVTNAVQRGINDLSQGGVFQQMGDWLQSKWGNAPSTTQSTYVGGPRSNTPGQ